MTTELADPNQVPRNGASAPVGTSQPLIHQHGREIQAFGSVRLFPTALSHDGRSIR
jgi:starvation-inducible DNA-binding protein